MLKHTEPPGSVEVTPKNSNVEILQLELEAELSQRLDSNQKKSSEVEQ